MYICECVISKKFNKVMNDPGAANLHLHMIVMSNEQAYSTYNTNGCYQFDLENLEAYTQRKEIQRREFSSTD